MDKDKMYFQQLYLGLILALSGAILMFFGIEPLSLRIILEFLGITFIAKSYNFLKIKKT